MSEITKLYENAGVKLKYSGWLDMGDLDTQMTHIQCDTKEEWDECVFMSRSSYSSDDENYDKPKMEYPPFTAEKQLRILKCLTVNRGILIKQNVFFTNIENPKNVIGTENIDSNFEEGFASLINILWQSFTEEEKQQIKEILE